MSAGNPELVIHEGDIIREWFIDKFLEGLNVTFDVEEGRSIALYVTGSDIAPEDGFPMVVGYLLDDDFNFDDKSDHICIHWQTITRIEVW